MKKLFIIIVLLQFLFLLRTYSQNINVDYLEYDLPNGLHVILHQDNTTPIVAVTVMYHVGSKNENPDRTGFAHFFEHLMFEGTDNIERGAYSSFVEKAGGKLNANTNTDRTFYYELLPSNQFELGLWLESERMMHAKVEMIGIETQRGVIKEERRQRYDNTPYGTIMEQVALRAFKNHPYRWTTIGSMEHIQSATEMDYLNFYKTFYVPNNAVLSIAGDINIEEAKKSIEKYFGEIPRGKNEIFRPDFNAEQPFNGEIRDTVFDNIMIPAVIQAYHIPARHEDDFYPLQLLCSILSDGESSRFSKILKDEKQLAQNVSAFAMQNEHPGLAYIFAMPLMQIKPEILEGEIEVILQDIKDNGVLNSELEKAKNQTESDFVNGNATIARRAENLASYYTFYGNTALINTELQKYMNVTVQDIQRVAKKYFTKDNRVVLYYLPNNQQ